MATIWKRKILGGTVAVLVIGGALWAAQGRSQADVRTLSFYDHDTQQTFVDAGDPGPSGGDDFLFAGDLFDHKGGTKVGRLVGHCTTVGTTGTAGAARADETLCEATFVLADGQILTEGIFHAEELFGGQTLTGAITGGSGAYRHARGDATVQIPTDVPNQTDANFVLRLSPGS
jgi:hypothetical protein